jgi:hypothetical protein
VSNRKRPRRKHRRLEQRNLKGGLMKRSARIISFVMALAVTTAMVPKHQRKHRQRPLRLHPSNRHSSTPRLGVRQPVPQSEPLGGTRRQARSSELVILAASKGGTIDRTINNAWGVRSIREQRTNSARAQPSIASWNFSVPAIRQHKRPNPNHRNIDRRRNAA